MMNVCKTDACMHMRINAHMDGRKQPQQKAKKF